MSKIIVDQIQKTGGTAFTMPSTDGSANSTLQTDGAGNLSFAAPASTPSSVPDDDYRMIGSLVSSSSRQNVYSTGQWTSSGPWTTYYHSWQDTNSRIQGVNMAMGDGYPDDGTTTQNFYVEDGMHNESRHWSFAHNSRMGFYNKDYFEYDNETSQYSGCVWRMIPFRNTTSSSITRSLGFYCSAYNNDYGGASIYSFTPSYSSGTTYANVTGGTWTDIDQETSSGTQTNFGTKSVTIPANTTIVLFVNSSTVYQTTYRMKNTNMVYNLHSFCPNTGDIVCDIRMLHSLKQSRIISAGYTSDNFYKIYNNCADLFGDR